MVGSLERIKQDVEVNIPSEKSFGIVFSIVFVLVGLHPLLFRENVIIWPLCVSFVILVLAYRFPNTLIFPNKMWFKLGLTMGSIIAPIVMLIVYISTLVPIGLLMKLIGKDPLNRKFDSETESYWMKREGPLSSMKDQF